MIKKLSVCGSLFTLLVVASHAGSGGVQPNPGNYGFFVPDPPNNPIQVGSGNVDGEGTLTTDPGTQEQKTWKRGSDGQYRQVPSQNPPGVLSICIREQEDPDPEKGCPYPYTYKLDNNPVSAGDFTP